MASEIRQNVKTRISLPSKRGPLGDLRYTVRVCNTVPDPSGLMLLVSAISIERDDASQACLIPEAGMRSTFHDSKGNPIPTPDIKDSNQT
eukprot:3022371-Rhodomonas_salina.3